jgi:hypothetical protein
MSATAEASQIADHQRQKPIGQYHHRKVLPCIRPVPCPLRATGAPGYFLDTVGSRLPAVIKRPDNGMPPGG